MTYDQRGLTTRQVEVFDKATNRDLTTVTVYDQDGRETLAASPRAFDADAGAGTYSEFATRKFYDAKGQMIRMEQPTDGAEAKQYVHVSYDKLGRTVWTSLPTTQSDPTLVTDLAKTENTYYDPGWIRTMGKNANPNLLFDYNAMGQQTMRLPAKPGTEDDWNQERRTSWTYTVDGQKSSMTDYRGGVTTWQYDLHDNIVKAYDPAGVGSSWDSAVATAATYDGFDEAVETSFKKDTEANWHFTTFEYNKNGMVNLRLENGERDGNGVQTKAPKRVELTYDQSDFMTRQLNLGTTAACEDDERTDTTYFDTGWERQRTMRRRCRRLRRRLLGVEAAPDDELDALRQRQAAHADHEGRQRPDDRGARRRLLQQRAVRGRQPGHRQLPPADLGDGRRRCGRADLHRPRRGALASTPTTPGARSWSTRSGPVSR